MNQAQAAPRRHTGTGFGHRRSQTGQTARLCRPAAKWNKTYNLTALRDPAQTVSHHLLGQPDPLAYIEHAQTMLDVGSGGGQPGIPTAICRPISTSPSPMPTPKPPFCNKPSSNSALKRPRHQRPRRSRRRPPLRRHHQPRLCRTRRLRQLDRAPPQRRQLLGRP